MPGLEDRQSAEIMTSPNRARPSGHLDTFTGLTRPDSRHLAVQYRDDLEQKVETKAQEQPTPDVEGRKVSVFVSVFLSLFPTLRPIHQSHPPRLQTPGRHSAVSSAQIYRHIRDQDLEQREPRRKINRPYDIAGCRRSFESIAPEDTVSNQSQPRQHPLREAAWLSPPCSGFTPRPHVRQQDGLTPHALSTSLFALLLTS